MNTIWQALTSTPWWVFLIFFYLMKVGYDATKTNIVSLKRLFILPSVLLVMSIKTLITSVPPYSFHLSFYFFSLLCGIIGGWMLVKNLDLQFDKRNGLVKLPGSWTTLILILIIFSAKYYFGYSLATNPDKAQDITFKVLMLSVSGVCTGLFLGRLFCYLLRKRVASHNELSLKETGNE